MFEYTKEKLEEWKKKHGEDNVFTCSIDDKRCVIHKPTRKDLSFAIVGSNGGKDAVKMQEILLNQCWIAGDEEIKTNDTYFFAVSAQISELLEAKQAELKKL